jgi:hypothetical protein
MRARARLILGWVVVAAYAAALVTATVTTSDGDLRPGDRSRDIDAADAFVAAWERSLQATFVRTATFERRSDVTGAVISSEDVLAQRPPARLHRQMGGLEGRDGKRPVVCVGRSDTEETGTTCRFGRPTLPSYEDDVAAEVAALRTQVTGATAVYAVERVGDGCFLLAQQRVEPRASFGTDARFCFDGETGARSDSRVEYVGGIVEVVAVVDVSGDVTDADLELEP